MSARREPQFLDRLPPDAVLTLGEATSAPSALVMLVCHFYAIVVLDLPSVELRTTLEENREIIALKTCRRTS